MARTRKEGVKKPPVRAAAAVKTAPQAHRFAGLNLLLQQYPLLPGILLTAAALIIGLLTYKDYGMAWDEPFQRGPGLLSYNYMFHGSEELLHRPNDNHGAGYEILLIMLEKAFGLTDSRDIFMMRHLATHILFLTAAFFFYVLALRLFKSKFLACLAFVMLVCAPRIYAHSFFNSKDVPFLSMLIITLYLCQLAFDKGRPVWFLVLGLAAGYATSIRIMGVLPVAMILFFLAADVAGALARKQPPGKLLASLGLFLAGFCSLLYMAWPYLWKSPVHHFVESFSKLSRFELWNGVILVSGKFLQSEHLPGSYFPTWFLLTNPEIWLLAGLGGVGLLACRVARKPLAFLANTPERNFLLYLVCFAAPIAAVYMFHSVIYDDWRHLYFIYPSFILLGIYVVHELYRGRYRRYVAGVCVAEAVLTGGFMVVNHPFNQVYFNYFVPHTAGYLHRNYEMDYWGCSFKQAIEYILADAPGRVVRINCDYGALLDNNVMMLPQDDRRYFQYGSLENSDYYITNFRGHYLEYPSADSVFSLSAMNSEFLCVYKCEKTPDALRRIRTDNIRVLRLAVADAPDDLDAITRLAALFDMNGQPDSAEYYYQKALAISPTQTNLLTGLAGTYYKMQRYPLAIAQFRKMIAADSTIADPYSSIAVCYYFDGKPDSAVYYLKRAIALSPGNTGYYVNLINTYNAMGNTDSASRYQQLMYNAGRRQ